MATERSSRATTLFGSPSAPAIHLGRLKLAGKTIRRQLHPSVYAYDRMGHPLQITGATTNSFVFSPHGVMLSEDAVKPGWNYYSQSRFGFDALQRRTALTNLSFGSVHSVGYDSSSRLSSVAIAHAGGDLSANYSYVPYSSLIEGIGFKQGTASRGGTQRVFDNADRLRTIVSTNSSGGTNVWLDFDYNAANQVATRIETDSSYWNYGYDALGQVTNGWHYWPNGSNVLGQTFNYAFDDIGNRRFTQTGGDASGSSLRTADYYPNLLNQYTNRTVPGYIEVNGAAPTNVSVSVNGSTTENQGTYLRRELSIDNSSGATSVWVNVLGTNSTATNVVSRLEHLPQSPESFTYDDDGNLIQDGLRTYGWDAENRLISVEIRTNVVTDSTLWQRVTCDYDYQHRRVRKQVFSWDLGAGQYRLSSSLKFFYDGWNLIGQVDEVTGVRMSFLWGADLSGTLQGAGGVGGLKALVVHNGPLAGSYFYRYDANGNVVALVDADTELETTRYEYGPFGELIRTSGFLVKANSFRFSTKWQDEETGLLYYGRRYYNASTGRWLNHDPIGENGGVNLYGFVGNCSVLRIDPLGEFDFDYGLFFSGVVSDSIATAERLGSAIGEASLIGIDILGYGAFSVAGYGESYSGNSELFQQIEANPLAFDPEGLGQRILVGTLKAEANILTFGVYGMYDAFGKAIRCSDYTALQDQFAGQLFSLGAYRAFKGFRPSTASGSAQQTLIRQRVLQNIKASQLARQSSNFDRFARTSLAAKTGADSALQGARLGEHLRQLETYGQAGFKELENGSIRYYGNLKPATTPGEMSGARLVREWTPETGAKRTWMETLDQSGTVRSVRPETGGPKVHYIFDANGNYTGTR